MPTKAAVTNTRGIGLTEADYRRKFPGLGVLGLQKPCGELGARRRAQSPPGHVTLGRSDPGTAEAVLENRGWPSATRVPDGSLDRVSRFDRPLAAGVAPPAYGLIRLALFRESRY